jgi:peptide/nickel transport system substrate-binding protein
MLDPAENGVYKEGSNGTGPFQFVTNEVGRKQVFRANPSYWGGGPHLETLEFIDLGEDPAASVAAIASGQVDLLYGAQIPVIPALDRIPNLQRYLIDTAYTAVARMQPQKPFDDKRVRQAVQWATDLDATLKAAHLGMGRVGEHHHVAPVHPEYAAMQPYKRDVVKAKALLAEAGYPNGVDCELYCQGNTAWELLAAQVMSEQWKEAGIRCKINNVPSTQYWEIWTKVPFGLTTWAHRPLGVMVLGLAYRTGGPWNESKYSNPKFDELLIKAEGLVDVEERRKVMAQLQQILLDDAPIVLPLWRGLSTYAHKKVKGFGLHPSQYIHPHEIWIDA